MRRLDAGKDGSEAGRCTWRPQARPRRVVGRDPSHCRTGGSPHRGALFLAELETLESKGISHPRAMASGQLGVDLLASGKFEQFNAWAAKRSSFVADEQAGLVDRLGKFYEAVLVTRRREAVRTWISRHVPSRSRGSVDAAQRINEWWVSDSPGRLALLADVLDAVERGLSAEAILDCVERQAKAVATSGPGQLESVCAKDDLGRTITIRVRGAEISAAFVPVVEAVAAVVGIAQWARRPQALTVTVPEMPQATDPLARTGLSAVVSAFGDRWLDECRTALNDFLARTEWVLGSEGRPSDQAMEEFSASEAVLLEALRVGADLREPDEDQMPRSPGGEAGPRPESRNTR